MATPEPQSASSRTTPETTRQAFDQLLQLLAKEVVRRLKHAADHPEPSSTTTGPNGSGDDEGTDRG
jgi:hypothetical protein